MMCIKGVSNNKNTQCAKTGRWKSAPLFFLILKIKKMATKKIQYSNDAKNISFEYDGTWLNIIENGKKYTYKIQERFLFEETPEYLLWLHHIKQMGINLSTANYPYDFEEFNEWREDMIGAGGFIVGLQDVTDMPELTYNGLVVPENLDTDFGFNINPIIQDFNDKV